MVRQRPFLSALTPIAFFLFVSCSQDLVQPLPARKIPQPRLNFLLSGVTVVDLGLPTGAVFAAPTDITDDGVVIGIASATIGWPPASRSFRWSPTTRAFEYLPIPENYYALAINELGRVVGVHDDGTTESEGFSWTESGGLVRVQGAPGENGLLFIDVNESGQAIGVSRTGTSFIWTPGSGRVNLSGQVSNRVYDPVGINDLGQVAGYFADYASGNWYGPQSTQLFVWSAQNGMTHFDHDRWWWSSDISNSGLVAGAINWLDENDGFNSVGADAGVWSAASGYVNIGALLPNATWSYSNAVNDAGQVVGGFVDNTAGGENRPFAWTFAEGARGLPLPAGALGAEALGINASGQIIGHASYSSPTGRVDHPVLWTLPLTVLTPEQGVNRIEINVEHLVSAGSLSAGHGTSLEASLNAATAQLNAGNVNAATAVMQAFIKKVQALVNAGKLSASDGAVLIADASAVIARLSS